MEQKKTFLGCCINLNFLKWPFWAYQTFTGYVKDAVFWWHLCIISSSWNLTNTQLRTAPNSKIPCENSESTTGEVYNAKQPDTEPSHEIIVFEMHLETQFWNSSNKQTKHSSAFWSYVSSDMESHVSIKEPKSTSREQPKLCSRE